MEFSPQLPIVGTVKATERHFDANALRDSANYLYHRYNNQTRVVVKNVIGIPDSTNPNNPQEVREHGYFHRAALLPEGYWQRTITNHACTTASQQLSDRDNCYSLATANNDTTHSPNYNGSIWVLDGKSHAPGIVFFDGSVTINNGYYTNTFISTHNLTLREALNKTAQVSKFT